jgi:basic amino acid/polyamine antiporter, APA family
VRITLARDVSRLRQSLRTLDGVAVVVGMMVGTGIFRTPSVVAGMLGRPWLTFVAWTLGGVVGVFGAMVFAELATRHPQAGGKYVYARAAWGKRAGFVVGWIEVTGIYSAAIAAIAVVAGEYVARLVGLPPGRARPLGVALVLFFTSLNLLGVATGRLIQNVTTAAKAVALLAVVAVVFVWGKGAGWTGDLPGAPSGFAALGALAVAFQAVIWTYYGYPDAAKIAEEVKDPERSLPRIFLTGILSVTVLYLLLNAAFLHVLPFARIASSNLVAADVAEAVLGARGATVVSALALLVVLASLNGNVFVTPRVAFGMAREGLAPRFLARVNAGGTPWTAMLLVGLLASALAASGTFEQLLALAITFVLVTDGAMVLALLKLRARTPAAPFRVPLYPMIPLAFLATYALLFLGAAVKQPITTAVALVALGAAYLVARYSVTA